MSHLQIESVIEAAHTIPCAPAILPKLLELMRAPAVHARDLERVVISDPGLATGVLRLANSAFFSRTGQCNTIGEAILRLGSVTLMRLVTSAAAARWLTFPVDGYGWEPGNLCVHSLCVAIAADHFSRVVGYDDHEIAYTAGLIHDVGKLALAYSNSEALEIVASLVPELRCSWREAEHQVLGYDSTNVSERLLRLWGFSESLVMVGSHYYMPSRAPEEHRKLVTVVHAAKHAALGVGLGVGADGFRTELDETALVEAGFTAELIELALPDILESVERLVEADGRLRWFV